MEGLFRFSLIFLMASLTRNLRLMPVNWSCPFASIITLFHDEKATMYTKTAYEKY